MELQISRTSKFFCLIMVIISSLDVLASAGATVYASENETIPMGETSIAIDQNDMYQVADELKNMFIDGDIHHLDINYLVSKYGLDEIKDAERFIGISEEKSLIIPKQRFVERNLMHHTKK